MATNDIGRVTPIWRGFYSAATTYELNDIVIDTAGSVWWHKSPAQTTGVIPEAGEIWDAVIDMSVFSALIQAAITTAQTAVQAAQEAESEVAEDVRRAETAAQSAEASAEAASESAAGVGALAQAAEQSKNAALTAASQAAASASSAGASATSAGSSAQTAEAAKAAAQTAATQAAGSAETASGAAAVVEQKKTEALAAIEAKGEEVLESIPEDYTELSGDVGDLKTRLNDVRTVDITSKNLVNPADLTHGMLQADGTIATNGAWNSYDTSDFIPIKANTNFVMSSYRKNTGVADSDRKGYLLYDSSKGIIANSYVSQAIPQHVINSSVDGYVRIFFATTSNGQVELGDTASGYEAYSENVQLNDELGLTETMSEDIESKYVRKITTASKNLINPEDLVVGAIQSNGSVATNGAWASYNTSDYIPIVGGTNYALSAYRKNGGTIDGDRKGYLLFDSDKTPITSSYVSQTGQEFIINSSVDGFVRVFFANYNNGQLEVGNAHTTYEPYYSNTVFENDVHLSNTMKTDVEGIVAGGAVFTGKKILNIGDSISEDRAGARSYAYQFAQATGATLTTDYGLSGSTLSLIAEQGTRGCIYSQAVRAVTDHADANYDIIMIDGGTNDANQNRTLGTIVGTVGQYILPDYTATFDESTIIGALEKIFYTLRNQYVGAAIVFIIPHKADHTGSFWESMITALRTVCEKWSIPIVDVYGKGELNSRIIAMRTDYTDEGGTHPNTLGIQKFYLPMLIEVLKEHVR